jgi:hypothetical protein
MAVAVSSIVSVSSSVGGMLWGPWPLIVRFIIEGAPGRKGHYRELI